MHIEHPLPYYAVIFTSKLATESPAYTAMAQKMEQLAAQQEGYLGIDSARTDIGITVSYWKSELDILNWKKVQEHVIAQELGKTKFYDHYSVRVCKVERHYEFTRPKE